MCQEFSKIMKERLDWVGIEIELDDLVKLDMLPQEKKNFVLGWNVRGLQSVNGFWNELHDSKVLNFDSYVIKLNNDLPCLVIGVDKFLCLSRGGGLHVYESIRYNEPLNELYDIPDKFDYRIVRGCLTDRVVLSRAVEALIRKANDGEIKFDSFMLHPSYSGFRNFLCECYKYFGVSLFDKEYDWVYPILPQKEVDDTILSIGSFYITDFECQTRLARIGLYRDKRVVITSNISSREVVIHDAFEYSGSDLAVLILHALECIGITYGGNGHPGFWQRDVKLAMKNNASIKFTNSYNDICKIMDSINNCNWRIGYEWQKEALLQEGTL